MTEREFIRWLADNYAERRTDVYEQCHEFLDTGSVYEDYFESRFINATITIKGEEIKLFYDTLTTQIEYYDNDKNIWHTADNHDYYD